MSYNGWTNRETWCVILWIETDEVHSVQARSVIDDNDTDRDKENALREYVEEFMLDNITSQSSLASDLLSYVLSKVNWNEIVKALEEE